jgi:hypothetical protein
MRNRLITEKKRRDEEDHGCGPHSACELFGVDMILVRFWRQLRNQGGDGGMGPMGAPGRQVASPSH